MNKIDFAFQYDKSKSRYIDKIPGNIEIEQLLPQKREILSNVKSAHGIVEKYDYSLHSERFMLKVSGYKNSYYNPEVELIVNKIFRLIGIPVPDFCMTIVTENKINRQRVAFVQKDFIEENRVERLSHLNSFITSQDQYTVDNISKVIQDKSSAQREDLRLFAKMMLADAIVGNSDRHWRNIAMIKNKAGFRLSPMFDNDSFALIYPSDPNPELEGTITVPNGNNNLIDTANRLNKLGYNSALKDLTSAIDDNKIKEIIHNSLLLQEEITILDNYISMQLTTLRGLCE
ncbi:MAG: hypothetical protein HN353_13085 [Bdellovibrionales bacterium]|jgi:hypothetical protein|nr:hypothetical protein [Bdellovibrionales bacterium]MBT3524975.1 hypothetical protein [Bdellovibrionales bacterium]MBT7670359.1 hypothetical protein [Bdellovibrionales bacterium]MBT7766669.1 hypothetical protein [Bdellovibrionales bacterium]